MRIQPADRREFNIAIQPNQEPLVSIIMPAYNAATYLPSAIQSVFEQSYSNWELLVVDDASTDSTLHVANSFAEKDSRVRVFPQSENGGVTAARNKALQMAGGDYLAFLDADDLWDSEKLLKQVGYMTHNNTLICYCGYRRINEEGRIVGRVSPPLKVTYSDMLKSNFIGNLTGIYNAKVLGKQYLEDFGHEDYIAWLELIKVAGEASSVDEELASYRVYRGSTSSNKLRTISWQWRIYRESQALGLVKSSWLIACYGIYAILKRT